VLQSFGYLEHHLTLVNQRPRRSKRVADKGIEARVLKSQLTRTSTTMASTWPGKTSPSPLPQTMISALVSKDTKVTIRQTPLPSLPHHHALLIRVVTAGTNPKDWKLPAGILQTITSSDPEGCNSGDDVAGYVAAVGPDVVDFHVGDAVAGLHELGVMEGGAFAEYAVVMDWVAFHIAPSGARHEDIDFDAAATMPMGSLMGSIGMFGMLRVSPGPWAPFDDSEKRPVIVYGAAGAVAAYAVKLAVLANVHPLICVAGNGMDFVREMIEEEKGDVVIDYRKGNEYVVSEMKSAACGQPLLHAFDGVTNGESWVNLSKVIAERGHISLVLPGIREDIPAHIQQSTTMAGGLWKELGAYSKSQNKTLGRMDVGRNGREFGHMYSRLIGLWFRQGKLKPHPYKVVPGGLRGVETALQDLKEGRTSASKFVVRVDETEELRTKANGQ
jgi:NADPH:quinone reductase